MWPSQISPRKKQVLKSLYLSSLCKRYISIYIYRWPYQIFVFFKCLSVHCILLCEKNTVVAAAILDFWTLHYTICMFDNQIIIRFFNGGWVARSLILCVCFVDCCLSICTFSFCILLSVLLRCADSDYPFGNFKLFNGSNISVSTKNT